MLKLNKQGQVPIGLAMNPEQAESFEASRKNLSTKLGFKISRAQYILYLVAHYNKHADCVHGKQEKE